MKETYIALVERAPDGVYAISFPDLPGAHAQAMTLADVQQEATNALSSFISAAQSVNLPLAAPSASITLEPSQMAVIVTADTEAYSRMYDTTPVRKTVSLPAWMAKSAEKRGISLSKAIQDTLRDRLME